MLNEIKLIGTLGKDPEIKNRENGDIIVTLSLATSESWTDKATLRIKHLGKKSFKELEYLLKAKNLCFGERNNDKKLA